MGMIPIALIDRDPIHIQSAQASSVYLCLSNIKQEQMMFVSALNRNNRGYKAGFTISD